MFYLLIVHRTQKLQTDQDCLAGGSGSIQAGVQYRKEAKYDLHLQVRVGSGTIGIAGVVLVVGVPL